MARRGDGESRVRIRRMAAEDIETVTAIAAGSKEAPHWRREAYLAALDPESRPARIALVGEDAGDVIGFAIAMLVPPQAELEVIAVACNGAKTGDSEHSSCRNYRIELKRIDITEVTLEVRESNVQAIAFYRAMGFSTAGRRAFVLC